MYFHGINRQEVPNKSFFLYISLSRQVRNFPYLCIFLSEPLFYCFKSGEIFFNPRRGLLSSHRGLLSSRRGLSSSRRELKNLPKPLYFLIGEKYK